MTMHSVCAFCGTDLSNRASGKRGYLVMVINNEPQVVSSCTDCFLTVDRQTRPGFVLRFIIRHTIPDIVGSNKLRNTVLAHYKLDYIVVTPALANLDEYGIITTLSHEYIHRMLYCDYGICTTSQFDVISFKPLDCLGGRTLNDYLLECIRENNPRIA